MPTLKLGAELYAGNCSTCHGIAGSGISKGRLGAGHVLGAGPPLQGVGAQAADFYLRMGFMPLRNIYSPPGPERERVLFSNKEIESLVQYVAALDLSAQRKVAGQIQRLLLAQTPISIPYWIDGLTASTQNVGGLNPTSIAQLYLNRAYMT